MVEREDSCDAAVSLPRSRSLFENVIKQNASTSSIFYLSLWTLCTVSIDKKKERRFISPKKKKMSTHMFCDVWTNTINVRFLYCKIGGLRVFLRVLDDGFGWFVRAAFLDWLQCLIVLYIKFTWSWKTLRACDDVFIKIPPTLNPSNSLITQKEDFC